MNDEPRVRVLGPDPSGEDAHDTSPPPTRWALGLLAVGAAATIAIAVAAWPEREAPPVTTAAAATTSTFPDTETPPFIAPAPTPQTIPAPPEQWEQRTIEWFNAGSIELTWHDLGDPEWVTNPVVWQGGFAAVAGIGVNAVLATSGDGTAWELTALPGEVGDGHAVFPHLFAGDDDLWLLSESDLSRIGADGSITAVQLPGEIREYAPGSEVLVVPQRVLALGDGTVVIDGTFSMNIDWISIVDALDLIPWRANPPLWDPAGSLLYLGDVEAGIPVTFAPSDAGVALTVTDPASSRSGTLELGVPDEASALALDFLRETGGVQGSNLRRVIWRIEADGQASGPHLGPPVGTSPVLTPAGDLLSVVPGRFTRQPGAITPTEVWRSSDGVTWEASSPVFVPGEQLQIGEVVSGGDALLAVGSARQIVRIAPEVTSAEQAPVAWLSGDGQTWQGAPIPNMTGIGHHPALGWVGTAWTGESSPWFSIVHSAGGLEWSSAPISSLPGLNPAGIAGTDDAIVITLAEFAEGGRRAFAWSGPVLP